MVESWIDDQVSESEVEVALEVALESKSSLVDNGAVGDDDVNDGSDVVVLSSEGDSVLAVEGDWLGSSFVFQGQLEINGSIGTIVSLNFSEGREELGGDSLVSVVKWEDGGACYSEHGVEGVFVDPELFRVAVLESWWVVGNVTGIGVSEALSGTLWHIEETIEEDLDQVGSFLHSWSGGHGEVEVQSFNWDLKVVRLLVSDHSVELLDNAINSLLEHWDQIVLDDVVDDRTG